MDQPVANKHTVNTLTDSGDFRWYLTTHSSWFFGMGLQMVIFPYLVTEVLLGSPKMIGIAQMSMMAPTWFLMLFAGVIADKRDGRRLLILLNAIAMIPPFVLALVVASGTLTYALIIVYALSMGVLSAFSMPTRDSILNDVVAQIDEKKGDTGSKVQRAVGLTNMMQFGGQTAGMITAAAATFVGTSPLILLHALIVGLGMIASQRLHPAVHAQAATQGASGASETPPLKAISQGLSVVYQSPILLPLVLSALSVGLFFAGSFMVTLPVLVREEYGGGIYRFSAATVSFWDWHDHFVSCVNSHGKHSPSRSYCAGCVEHRRVHVDGALFYGAVLCPLSHLLRLGSGSRRRPDTVTRHRARSRPGAIPRAGAGYLSTWV